jgi:hypothetical protein
MENTNLFNKKFLIIAIDYFYSLFDTIVSLYERWIDYYSNLLYLLFKSIFITIAFCFTLHSCKTINISEKAKKRLLNKNEPPLLSYGVFAAHTKTCDYEQPE